MSRRVIVVLAACAIVILAACGSSSKSTSNSNSGRDTTTTTPKNLHVETPDGQVSLSLNGQLPPNWPSTFPVPSGATAAGSGSLVNQGSGVMIAVYDTSQSPADTYNFYKANSSLTVTSSTSSGVGNLYLGTIKLGGTYAGSSVVITSRGSTTHITIILKSGSPASTTTAT
jgi:hypothetical protein